MDPILLALSPQAKEFILLLRSLDYLPAPLDALLTSNLLRNKQENHIFELQEVKREASIILFENKDALSMRMRRFLTKDWNILFG